MSAIAQKALSWFDSSRGTDPEAGPARRLDWARVVPFAFLHLGCLGVLWVGWSPVAVVAALLLMWARAFFVTAFYHRYFSHRSYRTSRGLQFLFAVLGNTAAQRGPLWWAAHHRRHHRSADLEDDPHSPSRHGLWWSHMGWLTSAESHATRLEEVPDLARFPELVWLNRFDSFVPLAYGAATFGLGSALSAWGLGTDGLQMLVWCFFVSTVGLFHITCLVNSAAHTFGRRRFATGDDSRNSLWIALLTLGEGWHNNHHHYPAATRQGFYWWEIDVTYGLLRAMAAVGWIWKLNPVPPHVLERGRADG